MQANRVRPIGGREPAPDGEGLTVAGDRLGPLVEQGVDIPQRLMQGSGALRFPDSAARRSIARCRCRNRLIIGVGRQRSLGGQAGVGDCTLYATGGGEVVGEQVRHFVLTVGVQIFEDFADGANGGTGGGDG